jgi:thioesterase domain-containing protein
VAPEGGYFPDVRVIRLEGDQAAPADAVLHRKHCAPECVLVNGLGATETGLTRRYFVDRNTEIAGGILPVGYPVEDMEVLLLDERGDPVECGQAGDIAVKSGYLAVGYWRNPELTNVRFRHCEGEDGLRTYLTGDLGRMRADGCLEHLGRRDFQVKIRGHRVDVAEVESALCGLEEVREAAVAAFDDTHGEKRLAAYLVPAGQRMPPAGALRRFVAERVPDYMIPSLFLTVASLPLNLNGKLDRAALPAPEPASSAARVEPRNAAEEALAGIWRAVLGLGEVGVRDDFFEAGGDSLLAASMFARIRRRFGKDLPVATILEAPTIERLARAVCEDGWAPGPSTLAPLQPNGSRPPFFCFHPADGQVLFYRGMARALGPDQPVYGLQAAGLDGREPPLVRVEEMAARYLREMREVQPQGPYRLGGHCLGVLLALEVAQQLQAQGERVGLLVSFDTDLLWQMVSSPREAVRYHLATLSRLSARGKLAYLAERARYNVARLAGTMAAKAGALYGALGRPLPAGLRGMVIRELNHQAGIRYVPRPYGGRLILFLDDAGAPRDRALFWETVAAGGVEVQSVPGRDAGIFSEPNVRVLAGKLRACLESCS